MNALARLATVPLATVALAAAPAAGLAQPARPAVHVSSGQPLARGRTFAAARAGDRLLVAWVEDRPPRTALRAALYHAAGDGLDRDGDERTVAAQATAVAVSWDGARGAVVYVVPRTPPPFRHRPRGAPRTDPTLDPLGAQARSGGEVMFQRLDASGAAVGRPVAVFSENARAYRVAVAPEGDGYVVAWTGAASVDGEIRGTVRALRVDAAGAPRSFASSTGFYGEPGDALFVVADAGHARVVFTGERCATRPELPPPTSAAPADPSARVEPPTRRLMPQEGPREVRAPPVECDALAVHATELRRDETFGPLASSPPLATDAVALTAERAVAAVGEVHGAALAELPAAPPSPRRGAPGADRPRGGPPEASPWEPSRAPSLAESPRQAPSLALRERPPEDATYPAGEYVVAAPEVPDAAAAIHRPAALGAATRGDATTLVALRPDRRQVVLATRPGPASPARVTPLVATAGPVMDLAVLPGGESAWVLVRAGVWSGHVVFVDAARPPAAPPAAPPGADEAFGRLLLRALVARAAFTAFENVISPWAERPESVTSPRTSGMISVRSRLQARWSTACGALRTHAQRLVRGGADPGLALMVRQRCEIPGEITLGVPINPNL